MGRIPSLEQGLLAELRAALADMEIRSELRSDLGCLAVDTSEDRKAWIFLSFGNRYFSWNNAQEQHPVFDIEGATRRIAAARRSCGTADQSYSQTG